MNNCFYIIYLISIVAIGQDKTTFLDEHFYPAQKADFKYRRVVKDYSAQKTSWDVMEYYTNGQEYSSGVTIDKDDMTYDGQVLHYYDNGQIKESVIYSNGNRKGNYKFWYPNGNKSIQGEYVLNQQEKPAESLLRILTAWDETNTNTVVLGNGTYENNTEKIQEKGTLVNGFRNGVWTGHDKVYDFSFRETYENGKFITGESTCNGKKIQYQKLDEPPLPELGITKFYEYVASHFENPQKNPGSGKIELFCLVNANGTLGHITVIKSLRPDLDQELIRSFKSAGKWRPGESRGVPVNRPVLFPFKL